MDATYMDCEITEGVTTEDGKPGQVDLTVSLGEINGLMITVKTDTGYEVVELNFTAVQRLMFAAQDAYKILGDALPQQRGYVDPFSS